MYTGRVARDAKKAQAKQYDKPFCAVGVGFYGAEMCQEVCPVAVCLPDPNIREDELTLYERAVRLHSPEDVPPKEDLDAETSRFRNPDWDNVEDPDAKPGEDWAPYWDDE